MSAPWERKKKVLGCRGPASQVEVIFVPLARVLARRPERKDLSPIFPLCLLCEVVYAHEQALSAISDNDSVEDIADAARGEMARPNVLRA
jgi:hypothetical protein